MEREKGRGGGEGKAESYCSPVDVTHGQLSQHYRPTHAL